MLHGESFLSNWATRIADALNETWLPREYLAEEHTHAGTQLEIDVATFEHAGAAAVARLPSADGAVARSWSPPEPQHRVALAVPDAFEVRVLTDTGGRHPRRRDRAREPRQQRPPRAAPRLRDEVRRVATRRYA